MTCAVWLLAAAVGSIDFFGYQGLDLAAVRAALPIHEGAPFDPEHFDDDAARDAIKQVTGHAPTDLGVVCCDPGGNGCCISVSAALPTIRWLSTRRPRERPVCRLP
ncbi:MAG: hypothetical protein P4L56_14485 [Candidatus Sulfopaludibacter sp.]|nr:hypothetical protein [Candidatus Sulfopaludibacter sp.]